MLAYDSMGRVLNEQQCALGHCTTGTSAPTCQSGNVTGIAYCYDLAGHQSFLTNGLNSPSYLGGNTAVAFSSTYDQAGRLSTLSTNWSDSTHPATLFAADPTNGYAPPGGLQQFSLGNNITVNRTYDDRLRIIGELASQF